MSHEESDPTQAAADAEIRLEHERELFKVEDARITALETQATAVIAAAIAIAAFFFAATDVVASWNQIVVVGLGAVALGTALIARADAPPGLGQEGRLRIQEVNDADEAARAMNEVEEDPVVLRTTFANAWKTLTLRRTAARREAALATSGLCSARDGIRRCGSGQRWLRLRAARRLLYTACPDTDKDAKCTRGVVTFLAPLPRRGRDPPPAIIRPHTAPARQAVAGEDGLSTPLCTSVVNASSCVSPRRREHARTT